MRLQFDQLRVLIGLALIVLFAGCGEKSTEPPPAPIPPAMVIGEESTLEIMTWNIEWFPKRGQTTIDRVKQILDTLDVDIVALQEIADTTAFRSLIRSLDGYAGLYSPDPKQNVTFKSLRHTFASHLVKQGRHPKEVADLMGHSNIQMTMRYMHLSPNQLTDAVHTLDGLTGMSQSVTKSEKNAGEPHYH